MKKLFIIANWKSNKTESEAREWLSVLQNSFSKSEEKNIIVLPSFTVLPLFKDSDIEVGAQDISPFEQGAYTGEVNGRQIREFAGYVLIGHSERRQNFGDTEDILAKKVSEAIKNGLKVIYCIQEAQALIPDGIEIVAYEPVSAIGTGNPDTPDNANEIAKSIKQKLSKVQYVLYGGSVTSENVASFTNMDSLDGVLVGGASLDAQEFLKIIKNA